MSSDQSVPLHNVVGEDPPPADTVQSNGSNDTPPGPAAPPENESGKKTLEDPVDDDPQTPDTQGLIRATDSDELSSDDDSEDEKPWPSRRQSAKYQKRKWWFQESAVKRNYCIVLGAWFLVSLGIACIILGIVLEVLYHTASLDVVRGFIFLILAAIVLVPSVYAVTHVYLAARRVGRIRLSSVWFFWN